MANRHSSYYQAGRPASSHPSRASLSHGTGYHPSYVDDAYLVPASASSRHPVTTPRGYSNSTSSSGQPTTTRTYAVTQDPRFRTRPSDHSRARRSTMDSTTRPPVIITTTQSERSHDGLLHSAGVRNGSPMRDEYRRGESQHYAVPASSRGSRGSARPYHDEDYPRRRERADGLLSAHDAEAYHQSRPSATYPSNPRHSTAAIDYGEDGYKYTNAGELVRYDLDHTKPTRSRRHDDFDRDYYRPRGSYAGSHRRGDGPRSETDRGYVTTHGRSDSKSGPPPSTRGFDRIERDHDPKRDHLALPAAPKPPKPLANADTTGSLRDAHARNTNYTRPVSVSQEPSRRDSTYRDRDDLRGRRDVRDSSPDKRSEHRRPHSMQSYDDSIPGRGFGIRTGVDTAFDDRRERELQRSDYHYPPEKGIPEPRRVPLDQNLSRTADGRRHESDRKESERDRPSHSLSDGASAGLGITAAAAAAAAGAVASNRNHEPRRGLEKQDNIAPIASDAPAQSESSTWTDLQLKSTAEIAVGRPSSPSEIAKARAEPEDSSGPSGGGGVALVKEAPQPVSDSDDGGRGRVVRRQRPSHSFDPNDTGDLRDIKEQLAALRVQDKGRSPDNCAFNIEQLPPSVSRRSDDETEAVGGGDRYAVGFPVDKKHARVVSPPREKRDDKPLRGILKQPSASFPEEANPIREGVAPHKEDKKLKEVPAGARWTKINRKVVNPEALTIGKERFEERDDFVIVLRVLSREEIQAYAAATQVLRERRRNRDDSDLENDHRHHRDDNSSRRHGRHRRQDDEGSDEASDSRRRDRDPDRDSDRRHVPGGDDDSEGSSDQRGSNKGDNLVRRAKRGGLDGDADERSRHGGYGDDLKEDSGRRRGTMRDGDDDRDRHREEDRYQR